MRSFVSNVFFVLAIVTAPLTSNAYYKWDAGDCWEFSQHGYRIRPVDASLCPKPGYRYLTVSALGGTTCWEQQVIGGLCRLVDRSYCSSLSDN